MVMTNKAYTLYQGDCLDILPTLEPGSVDAVITDPPYGTTACKWDSVIPFEPMWVGIKRVIKERAAVVLFGSQPFTGALVMSNPRWFRYEWIWKKSLPSGFLNANRRPLTGHENIMVFSQLSTIYNPQPTKRTVNARISMGKKSVVYGVYKTRANTAKEDLDGKPKSIIKFNSPYHNGAAGFHPTQKPVPLMEYLIKTYTNPGDTVLDFTMGSGTTGVAALRTGRKFIGIELDPDYFRIAEQRIKNAAGEFVMTDREKATGQMALFEDSEL